MFIVDFDDTLFNTHDFKKARMKALVVSGVSQLDYQETYLEASKINDFFTYSNERHAELLSLRGYSKEKVLAALEETTGERLREFLFPDTVEFMQKIQDLGHPLVLLSLGEASFQELKVKGSGVSEYFDRMFMVQDSKEHILHELVSVGEKLEEMWFINDKVGESLLIKNAFPAMNIVLKKSASIDEEEYKISNLPYFHTLTEIYTYVREKNT
ncbi:MAG TPA: HAD family hydrolase [Candidatus Magasanikbacteria bacterium]|nr:HAD family hydrolase [Candidatus Magasanikbacteria bacterium]